VEGWEFKQIITDLGHKLIAPRSKGKGIRTVEHLRRKQSTRKAILRRIGAVSVQLEDRAASILIALTVPGLWFTLSYRGREEGYSASRKPIGLVRVNGNTAV
jgi:hypothetical protein